VRGLRPARAQPCAGVPCARPIRLIVALFALVAAGTASAGNALSADLATTARAILGAGQGVYVEAADGTVLVAQAASRAVHPASVSKVPSTLALLAKLGPDYRFETHFLWNGPIVDGVLAGDLAVRCNGDVSLVDEDALLVAAHLNGVGIRRIAGSLRPSGSLIFDWLPDPHGARLKQALAGHAPDAAWQAVSTMGIGLTRPAVRFGGAPSSEAHVAPAALETPASSTVASAEFSHELVYRSQSLISLLKSLNDYSNNIFDSLVDAIGGASTVQAVARSHVPADLRDEITLADAAGADPRNRLSPRAAVQLLRALERELATTGHTLSDVLPVAGVDTGTLEARIDSPDQSGRLVGKTGTYGSYGASALVGAIRTVEHGTVYFAILDHGVPVPEARRRQDRFVRALLARYRTTPWTYHRDVRSAVARAEIRVIDQPAADRAAP
jgi:serine-type D-Ala-D-Ala carboxypeptidase/endopeptidase (penicillin-binding protein 4)